MASKRIFAFDILRVMAIFGILVCHSCFRWSGCEWIGRYFAQTFNLVFLLISAFLIGIKWGYDGSPRLKLSFVWQRLRRLMTTFYPFLVVAFLILYVIDCLPSCGVAVSQFLFLSWFKPLPYFGQLWYLTMIVICYLLCYTISNIEILKDVLRGNRGAVLLLGFVMVCVMCISISTLNGFPGAIFLYAMLYSLIFANAKKLISTIIRIPLGYWIALAIIINTVALYLYYDGLFSKRLMSYGVSALTSATVFGLAFCLFRDIRPVKIVTWLSGISFEVYLVHEIFLGPINVYHYFNHPIGFIVLVILSILSAMILKQMSSAITKVSEALYKNIRSSQTHQNVKK